MAEQFLNCTTCLDLLLGKELKAEHSSVQALSTAYDVGYDARTLSFLAISSYLALSEALMFFHLSPSAFPTSPKLMSGFSFFTCTVGQQEQVHVKRCAELASKSSLHE